MRDYDNDVASYKRKDGEFGLIQVNKLKGIIVSKGMTQEEVAKCIQISPQTFYRKMKAGKFGSDEIDMMIKILNIDDPMPIFFAKEVTQGDTK